MRKRKSLLPNNKNVALALVKSYTLGETVITILDKAHLFIGQHFQKYLVRAGLFRGTLWPDYRWRASVVFPDNPHRTDSCTHTSLPVWMTASWGLDSPRHLWISLQSQVNRMIYNKIVFHTCISKLKELNNLQSWVLHVHFLVTFSLWSKYIAVLFCILSLFIHVHIFCLRSQFPGFREKSFNHAPNKGQKKALFIVRDPE